MMSNLICFTVQTVCLGSVLCLFLYHFFLAVPKSVLLSVR